MTRRITAIYENGRLRPTEPLPLAEGQKVAISIESPSAMPSSPPEDEIGRQIDSAKSLSELFDVLNNAPSEDDQYDLIEALNENRRRSGERLLFPPELKGKTW